MAPARYRVAFAATLLMLAGCGERVANRTYAFDEAIHGIDGSLTSAAVAVTGDEGMAGARVATEVRYEGEAPDHGAWVDGSTLYLSLVCAGGDDTCSGAFNAVVPADVSANLTTTSGSVYVEGIGGVATVESDRGTVDLDDIGGSVDVIAHDAAVTVRGVGGSATVVGGDAEVEVSGVAGRLTLQTVGGLIVGTDLTGPEGDVTSVSGQVWLTWSERPSRVEIGTEDGDVHLTVPAGPYHIVAGSVTGEVTLDNVDDDPDADAELRVQVQYANVTIQGV